MSEWTAPDEWKRNGAEWHEPCPVTSSGKDCCWVIPERKVIGCRYCSLNGGGLDRDQFIAHAGALGYLPAYHDHDTGRTEYMNGRQFRKGAKPKGWTRSPNGNHDYTGRALILVEGAKTADAVSALGLDAVCVPGSAGASTTVIGSLSKARSVTLWPDHNGPDQQHASYRMSSRRGAALRFGSDAPDIRWIDSGKLEGAELNGCDAANIIGALRGAGWDDVAIREAIDNATVDGVPPQEYATPSEETHGFARIRDIGDAPLLSPPLIPGMVWPGRVSVVYGIAKIGKSELLSQGLAALFTGEAFLGQRCNYDGRPICVACEMTPQQAARYIRKHGIGLDSDAPIYIGQFATVEQITAFVEAENPCLVIVDTLTMLAASADVDINDAVRVRQLIMTLKLHPDIAVLLVHHSSKATGEYRNSTDIAAVVDIKVQVQHIDSNGETTGDNSVSRRRLTMHGRGINEVVTADFNRETGRYYLPETEADVKQSDRNELQQQIFVFVAEHIGCSKSDVVKTVAKNRGEVLDEITKMHGIGMLRVEVVKNRHSLFPGVRPTDPE